MKKSPTEAPVTVSAMVCDSKANAKHMVKDGNLPSIEQRAYAIGRRAVVIAIGIDFPASLTAQ